MTDLPANVYRVKQRDFTAIPREPWVYWVSDAVIRLFEDDFSTLADVFPIDMGLKTSNNMRFVRKWWEVSQRVRYNTQSRADAIDSGARWFPYAKGAARLVWSGAVWDVVLWYNDGEELKESLFHKYPYLNGNPGWCTHDEDLYFQPTIVWGTISSSGLSASFIKRGGIISNANYGIFAPEQTAVKVLAILNSAFGQYLLGLLSPTINFNKGEVEKLPLPELQSSDMLGIQALGCIRATDIFLMQTELSPAFNSPPLWITGIADLAAAKAHLAELESQINDEVYCLYGISDADRAAIEAELAGDPIPEDEEEIAAYLDDDDDEKIEAPMDREELAVRWISYAVGVVLGRFTIGDPSIDDLRLTINESKIVNRKSKIGNAIYYREDFAVGSLPAPSEDEFDELVGPPERFAYIDAAGGRHLFPAEVEASLRDLAVDDGITVLDAGHPRDLPTLVERALRLMLDFRLTIDDLRLEREGKDDLVNRKSKIVNPSEEVIRIGAGGDLRRFLSRDFFTDWHIKWYNIPYQAKAPVYWPLQSANRRYGFVLFHEKINKTTLYTLQRDYLDYKINGLKQRIGDLTAALETRQGSQRKRVARQVATLRETLAEVEAFAKTMARIVREGYEPAPNWIDDRIILRMAPLWELIPLWEQYPQKHWQRLQAGEYDWSHIARHYWPARVREACKENKSYAIAHGHPEWYAGE